MKKQFLTAVATALMFISSSHPGSAAPTEKARANLKQLTETMSCRNCELRELNFNRMDLSGADLEGADLSKSKFLLTNLSYANLKNSTLLGAEFGGADLGDADLTGADLRGVSLDTAYTAGAKMSGKIISTKPFEKLGVDDVKKNVYVENQAVPKKTPTYSKVAVTKPEKAAYAQVKKEEVSAPEAVRVDKPDDRESVMMAPVKKRAIPPAKTVRPVAPPQKKNSSFSAVVVPDSMDKKLQETMPPRSVQQEPGDGKNEQMAKVATEVVVPEKTTFEQEQLDNWARLLDEKRCYGCNLAGLDLSHENLKKADLEKADLSGCNLEKADLRRANLKGALLVGANLRGANLKGADLYRADLTDADLTGAKQKDISLDGAVTKGTAGLDGGFMLLGN